MARTDRPARRRLWWHNLTFGTRHPARRVGALAALGAAAGIAEGVVVVLAVRLASAADASALPFGDKGPSSTLAVGALALGAVAVLLVVHLATARLGAGIGAETERNVRTDLMGAYLRAPWLTQSDERAGDLQHLMMTNAAEISYGIQQAALALTALLNLVVVAGAAVAISPWSTLAFGGMAVVAFAIVRPLRNRTVQLARSSTASSAALAAEANEAAALARDVAVFGVHDRVHAKVASSIDALARRQRRVRTASAAVPTITRDVTVAAVVVALVVVIDRIEVPIGIVGATVVLLLRGLNHAQLISSVAETLAVRRASFERIRDAIERWAPDAVGGTETPPTFTRVDVRGAAFAYPGAPMPALRGVDLSVVRGEQLGIIGRSGAGKTTLAGLLLGVLVPTSGVVLVDGRPLGAIDGSSWHRLAAWVPQVPTLLSGSVADNIRFYRDLDDGTVLDAARRAGLGAELAEWADGIDHDAGPGGHHLSVGQRQRVALARAIAGGPRLLVLDEPTSALDAHSESAIRTALTELRGDAAVVVIAHRISTLGDCDRVAVLDDGAVVSCAAPAELAASSAYYREVVALSGG